MHRPSLGGSAPDDGLFREAVDGSTAVEERWARRTFVPRSGVWAQDPHAGQGRGGGIATFSGARDAAAPRDAYAGSETRGRDRTAPGQGAGRKAPSSAAMTRSTSARSIVGVPSPACGP